MDEHVGESLMKAQFGDIEGVTTRWLGSGSGEAIILLHGIGMSADCFLRNFDRLSERRHVVAIDMLGHGFTDYPHFDGAPQIAMARHVAAVLDQLSLSKACVVGSSYGGLVAALLYFMRPDLVRELVFVGSSGGFSDGSNVEVLRASAANALKAMRGAGIDALRTRLANIVFDPASVSETLLWMQATNYAYPGRADAYVDIIEKTIAHRNMPHAFAGPRIARLDLPVLAISGREDIRAPVEVQERESLRYPKGELLIYDRCGHFPFLEHPEKFDRDLLEFLGRHEGPPPGVPGTAFGATGV